MVQMVFCDICPGLLLSKLVHAFPIITRYHYLIYVVKLSKQNFVFRKV